MAAAAPVALKSSTALSPFPKTERAAAGIPAGEMFKLALRPSFLVWFFAMFLTAASELAPGQWVNMALTRTVHMQGIWLLIHVSGLMFIMRHFAGTVVHKLSSVGLLWCSCLMASLGLLALSVANSPVMSILAAIVWGVGVCYMWPTMLAAASEPFPRGGALNNVLVQASAASFRTVAILPAFLLLVFGAVWLNNRAKAGAYAQAFFLSLM